MSLPADFPVFATCQDPQPWLGRGWNRAEQQAMADFPFLLPQAFAQAIQPGDPQDPLLLQVLPSARELAQVPGYTRDPLLEANASPVPGLVRRFQGRALLLTSPACAMHCRYCFRRHAPLDQVPASRQAWQPVLAHLAGDPSLQEVILSGGDPLTLPDGDLAWLAAQLAAIPHLQRLRVHTRMAVAVPARVTDSLITWLTGTRLQPILMVHVNHPAELTAAAVTGLQRLARAGILLFNQSVLLAGVNDQAATLVRLSEALLAARVSPCYLHLLDPVAGAAHFAVPDHQARNLMHHLRRRLPGYAMPRLVREVPELGEKQRVAE